MLQKSESKVSGADISIFHRVPSRSEAWPRMPNYCKIWAEERKLARWLTTQNSKVCFETVVDKYSELWELTSFYAFRFLLVHLVVKHNAPLWNTQLFGQCSASRKLSKLQFSMALQISNATCILGTLSDRCFAEIHLIYILFGTGFVP